MTGGMSEQKGGKQEKRHAAEEEKQKKARKKRFGRKSGLWLGLFSRLSIVRSSRTFGPVVQRGSQDRWRANNYGRSEYFGRDGRGARTVQRSEFEGGT